MSTNQQIILDEIPLDTSTDLERKMFMAESFLTTASINEHIIHAGSLDPQKNTPGAKWTFDLKKKMVAHYLYSIVIEISIKVIWEIERQQPPVHSHDILARYNELSPKSRHAIMDMYNEQISRTKKTLSKYIDNGKTMDTILDFKSLEETLQSNEEIIKNFKYDARHSGKSSGLGSYMWKDNHTYMLSAKDVTIFPKQLLDYATSLMQV